MKTKFLDVIMDNKINWREHINHVAGKISHGIGKLIKPKNISKYQHWYPYIIILYIISLIISVIYGFLLILAHWGRVTYICVSKLTIIGSDNGLSPGRRQAIIWTSAGYC